MTSSTFSKGFLLLTILSFSAVSFAQDAFDAHVADLIILQPKQVQADVGITEKQRDKLSALAEAHGKKLHAYVEAEQKKGVAPQQLTPSDPTIVRYYAELKKKIFGVISPGQLRRLREITLQTRGYPMLLDPVVGKRMGISGGQRTKIKAAVEGFAKFAQNKMQTAIMGVRSQYVNVKPRDQADQQRLEREFAGKVRAAEREAQPRVLAAQRQMNDVVESTLSPAQRSTWKALLGKPFKAS